MSRILVLCCFLASGCENGSFLGSNSKDPIIAKVGDKVLFKSQLEDMIHEGVSAIDSAAIVDGYVHNWIIERLMIEEAEANIAVSINLDKLVEDYRSSLLVYNYEKLIIDTQLDTFITNAEKISFYNSNKNQFALSQPILKCIVAKFTKGQGKQISKALSKNDLTEAMFIIQNESNFHYLDTMNWITTEDLMALLPSDKNMISNLKANKVINFENGGAQFYVKVINFVDENKIPPLDYITAKVSNIILSDRKNKLLKNHRDKVYREGVNGSAFEIYKTSN